MAYSNYARHDPTNTRADTEFNSMELYLMRMDKRAEDRDTAQISGDTITFYMATLALFMNVAPRFRMVGFTEDEINKSYEELLKLGGLIRRGLSVADENIRITNDLKNREALVRYNIELNNKIFDAGIIYPMKNKQSLREIADADY